MADPIDTNVIIRFLVEDPQEAQPAFRGVFPFFERLERGQRSASLPPLVLFQAYFVLTSYYRVPRHEAAAKLHAILRFKGLKVPEKTVLRRTLEMLAERPTDLVDAYLAALCLSKGHEGVYSFDEGLSALGVQVLAVDGSA